MRSMLPISCDDDNETTLLNHVKVTIQTTLKYEVFHKLVVELGHFNHLWAFHVFESSIVRAAKCFIE